MAVKPHILSFDKARRGSYAPGPSENPAKERPAAPSADDLPIFNSPFRQASQGAAAGKGAARPRSRTRLASAQYRRGAEGMQARLVPNEGMRGAHAKAGRLSAAEAVPGRGASGGRRVASQRTPASSGAFRRGAPAAGAPGLEQSREEAAREEEEPQRLSRWASFKKARAKSRADRKFSRQFGGAEPSDASQSGPRAALYKAEMGSKQRQAARMQGSAATQAAAKKSRAAGSPSAARPARKLLVAGLVSVCLIASCLFLYPTARQYYHALRNQDRLNAEYQAIEARNGSLQSEVSSLGTAAGVEDRARTQFGWVKEGDQAVNVHGLDYDDDQGSSFSANISPGSVKAPATWYSPFLDALFGVG